MTTPLHPGGRISMTLLRAGGEALASTVLLALAVLALTLTMATEASAEVREEVLHDFGGVKDGTLPTSRLLLSSKGTLIGVTQEGGRKGRPECAGYGCGVVFEMKPSPSGDWKYRVIHVFCSLKHCPDGAFPIGGLISDSKGNLYGNTAGGGDPACTDWPGCGVVYQLSPISTGGWRYRVLYAFPGGSGGSFPLGPLTFDSAGNLYGTAVNGGIEGGACAFQPGCGLVFELMPNPNGRWTERVIYTFTGGDDGALPQGGLTFDSSGNLYGIAEAGGLENFYCVYRRCGVVFSLRPNPDGTWRQEILHSFTGGADGGTPTAGLVFDTTGNLFGTSSEGTVFELTPNPDGSWLYKVIGSPGGLTFAPVLLGSNGKLFGTANTGGDGSAGFVFEFSPNPDGTWTESIAYTFCSRVEHNFCVDGAASYTVLISDSAGRMYGVTAIGGESNQGVVFELHRVKPDQPQQ